MGGRGWGGSYYSSVGNLRWVVWLDVSGEGLYGPVSRRESGGVVLHSMWGDACCLAERGSKAPGSKYLPRMSAMSDFAEVQPTFEAHYHPGYRMALHSRFGANQM